MTLSRRAFFAGIGALLIRPTVALSAVEREMAWLQAHGCMQGRSYYPQRGRYVKIGREVTVHGRVIFRHGDQFISERL